MGLWDKWVLGWADPLILNPGAAARTVQLGQTSRTPRGTKDGIKINLPNKVINLADAAQRRQHVVLAAPTRTGRTFG